MSFKSLGSVKSHLSHTQSTSNPTIKVPSNQVSPLVYASLTLSPPYHCAIQMLHTTTISSLSPSQDMRFGKDTEEMRSSVVTLFTSGIVGNAMIYHHSLDVESVSGSEENNISDNLQMTLRVAGGMEMPVLQAGLFVLAESDEPLGISSSQSFLDFQVQLLPSKKPMHQVINIAEMSINKSSATVAAKIIQSELSGDPVLTWTHIDTHLCNAATPYLGDNTEQSHNTVAVCINVPLIRLQVGSPSHGVPTAGDVGIDPAIVSTFIKLWKPLIEETLEVGMNVWRNKIVCERRLLLALLTSAMEKSVQTSVRT